MTHAARSLVLLALGASLAQAQAPTAQAELMFRNAKRLLAQGKTAEACAAFDASQKLDPTVSTLLNQANCREKNGQLATAWGLFLDAERDTRGSTDDAGKQLHKVAADHAAKLEAKLSTLTITVPAERRVAGLEIRRGADPLESVMWDQALPIDGGTYTIVARAPGVAAWSTTVVIANAGDAKTIEVPKLRAEAAKSAPSAKAEPAKAIAKPEPAMEPAKAVATPEPAKPAPPVAKPAAFPSLGDGKTPWYCTESHRIAIGACRPDLARCEEFRATMNASIHDLSACDAESVVTCFAVGTTPYCAPSMAICERLRDKVQDRATACQERRVAAPAPPPPPRPRGPQWWCTADDAESTGICKLARGDCEAIRRTLLERRRDLSACHEVETAQCFELSGKTFCGPTSEVCEALRSSAKTSAPCRPRAVPAPAPAKPAIP